MAKKIANPDYVESEVDKMAREERERQRSAYHKKNAKIRAGWLSIGFIMLVLDQVSKWAVTELYLRPRSDFGASVGFIEWITTIPPILPRAYGFSVTPFMNIVLVWNKGVSFGMFSNFGPYMPFILVVVAIFVLGFFLFWLFQTHDNIQGFSCALVIGGALGNIIDRLRFGAVIDFIDIHALDLHWPAFNIADMCVVIGVSMLVLSSFVFDVQRKHRYRERRKIKAKRRQHMMGLRKR